MTDSEPVPWGKGEKQAGEASEIVPETTHLQAIKVLLRQDNGVPIEEWANECMDIAD